MSDLEPILKSLRSPHEREREQAIQALVRSRDIRALDLLKRVASQDESVAVRYLAKKAIFYLQKKLGTESEGVLEESATPTSPVSQKIQQILEQEEAEPKLRLLKGLTQRRHQEALPLLVQYDCGRDPPEVRSNFVLLLGLLGSKEELGKIRGFLEDEDPRVRANAIEALEFLETPKAYPLIVQALSDPDNRIRTNAIKAIRGFGKDNCLALLTRMLDSPKVWMRDSATYALGLIGGSEGVPLLERSLKDPEEAIRTKARESLERLASKGSQSAIQALEVEAPQPPDTNLEAFLDGDDLEQSYVSFEAPVPQVDPLRSEDSQQRIAAVEEIVETKDLGRLSLLESCARQEADPFVRGKMVIGLGRLGQVQSLPTLRAFLEDKVDRVRANAVESLGWIDALGSRGALLPLLEDSNNRVRANAVIALYPDSPERCQATLKEMLEEPEPLMRKSAFYAITDLGEPEVHTLLHTLWNDADPDLKGKVREYVHMCAEDGDAWARELAESGGETAPDFSEFEGEAPSGFSREEAREMIQRFHSLDKPGKQAMIQEAKADPRLETYTFLKDIHEDPDFEIKVQVKMALRSFDSAHFDALLGEEEESIREILHPPEIAYLEAQNSKLPTELAKDLNERMEVVEAKGYVEGQFPSQFSILNALREDTQDMLRDLLGEEPIQEVYLCYDSERMEPFKKGKKSLDSNRYSGLVNLSQAASRADGATITGSLLMSVKRPAYMLAILQEEHLSVFVRGSLQAKAAAATRFPLAVLRSVEALRDPSGSRIALNALGVLVELPGLLGLEAKQLYDRLQGQIEGRAPRAGEDITASKEVRRLDLLLQGGVISQAEYLRRKKKLDGS